ncbi:PAS domain-containing protein [Streptomyces sp. SL13]|uniref:PAS domain-containing protein n=1 Tax=Streptantibioticus silvisoli TaxID=2705255 RepID=A0AA90GZ05_9ACTN|nr:PAS domain-containing protein [Streptantibioticus silvisoli]MDI5970878.1 PAS domain-containing protein [Streptantibioticus silvisoli]
MEGLPDFPDDAQDDPVVWRNRALALLDRLLTPVAVCRTGGTILLANPAWAREWGTVPGRMRGRDVLDLLSPRSADQLHRIAEAVRLGHRSRYRVEVGWTAAGHGERRGELTVEPVSVSPEESPGLLVQLWKPAAAGPDTVTPPRVDDIDARLLALAASGATTDAMARAVGMTADGVNYHFSRLAERWAVRGRTALVARAYVLGVLDPRAWPPEPTA